MRVVADDLSGAVETAAVLGFERVRLEGDAEGAVLDLDTKSLEFISLTEPAWKV